MIFAKFWEQTGRDSVVQTLRKKTFKESGKTVWAKPDKALPQRVLNSCVFGAKYMLKEWGYTNNSVWADPEEGKVWVGDDIAIQVSIDSGTLKVEYGAGWEEWLTHADFPGFPQMVQKLRNKLEQHPDKGVGKSGSKGKHKGKGSGRPSK